MRVIAGTARRLNLVTPQGRDTRPTTDKYKETLFNMLQPHLGGCRFLDLFAGSGAIGIEALSRGAAYACFVENSRKAQLCIRQNLEHTHLADRGELIGTDVMAALARLAANPKTEPFDIIFLDPPYGRDLPRKVFEILRTSRLVTDRTLIVAEEELEEDFRWLPDLGFEEERRKQYKTNQHVFVRRKHQ